MQAILHKKTACPVCISCSQISTSEHKQMQSSTLFTSQETNFKVTFMFIQQCDIHDKWLFIALITQYGSTVHIRRDCYGNCILPMH